MVRGAPGGGTTAGGGTLSAQAESASAAMNEEKRTARWYRVHRTRLRIRSTATATTMMAPVAISCTQLCTPTKLQPVRMTAMSIAPTIDPAMVPSPPESDAPPMTTAAMTSSSRPIESVGSPTVSVENSRTPASPASAPAMRVDEDLHARDVDAADERRGLVAADGVHVAAEARVAKDDARRATATATASHTPGGTSGQPADGASSASRPRGSQSIFCSFARPFAAPRRMLIAPSVTMNGAMRRRATSAPHATPLAVAAPTPASTASERAVSRLQGRRDDDRREGDRRADGEIDPAADDDEGHPDRGDRRRPSSAAPSSRGSTRA